MCWFSLLNSEINSVFGLWGNHKMSFFFFRYLKILVEKKECRKMCSKCIFDHIYLVDSQDPTQWLACSKCSLDICGMNEGLMGARPFSSYSRVFSVLCNNNKRWVRWSFMITGVRSWNSVCPTKLTVLSNVTIIGISVIYFERRSSFDCTIFIGLRALLWLQLTN